MKKFRVSRVFATEWTWTVEAESEEQAFALLDEEEDTPTAMAHEEWLGPVQGFAMEELADKCKEVAECSDCEELNAPGCDECPKHEPREHEESKP